MFKGKCRILKRNTGLMLLGVFLVLLSCVDHKNQQFPPVLKQYNKTLQEFVDLRFGMFLCYNIMSYGAKWGEANFDISTFNPKKLDCNQWAKAAVSANMKFGLLTTKHHEGFCLWDSQVTTYDVASTPYKKDIVRQYVNAFRAQNLKVGLYYSIWDSTHNIDENNIGENELNFIKTQITELLTNYGTIDYFVLDGWFWRMGHHEVDFIEIRNLIRELQPNCLVTDHTHLQAPYHVDILYYEGPFGSYPSINNKVPSALGHCSFKGNGWFWNKNTPGGLKKGEDAKSLTHKLADLESKYCNFMLNCMPNRDGLLEVSTINLLEEVGREWKPNTQRAPLDSYKKNLVYSLSIQNVIASSGNAENLIDAQQYKTTHKHWVSSTQKQQYIVIDLGAVYKHVNLITIVPNHKSKPYPEMSLVEGNILSCKIYSSTNNKEYTEVGHHFWKKNANFRSVQFTEMPARYLKIIINNFVGPHAVIAELEVGSSYAKPKRLPIIKK